MTSKFKREEPFEPGDRVKIVDKWIGSYQNSFGGMDNFLGTNVTIKKHLGEDGQNIYKIYEDEGAWVWFDEMFEDKIPNLNLNPQEIFELLLSDLE